MSRGTTVGTMRGWIMLNHKMMKALVALAQVDMVTYIIWLANNDKLSDERIEEIMQFTKDIGVTKDE